MVKFQGLVDNHIMIIGEVDPITTNVKAKAYTFRENIATNLDIDGVKKQPYLLKEFVAKFANEALEETK